MSLELQELVAEARSAWSTSVTERRRPAASRAMPAPLMPPPMMRRSTVSVIRRLTLRFSPFVPPQQPQRGLGVRDDAIADPFEGVGDLRLEDLEVLAHVELRAHVSQAP